MLRAGFSYRFPILCRFSGLLGALRHHCSFGDFVLWCFQHSYCGLGFSQLDLSLFQLSLGVGELMRQDLSPSLPRRLHCQRRQSKRDNRHLLRLQQFRSIQILTPAAFLALIGRTSRD